MVDDYSSRPDDASPAPLRAALSRLAACADQLAAGASSQPDRQVVARYMDALELGIHHCLRQPELGCWLDVLCPLKENLGSLYEYVQSPEPVRIDPALLTAAVVLTHLALSLEQQPEAVLVREVLLDVMGARVWSWPLPADARPALRAAFGARCRHRRASVRTAGASPGSQRSRSISCAQRTERRVRAESSSIDNAFPDPRSLP